MAGHVCILSTIHVKIWRRRYRNPDVKLSYPLEGKTHLNLLSVVIAGEVMYVVCMKVSQTNLHHRCCDMLQHLENKVDHQSKANYSGLKHRYCTMRRYGDPLPLLEPYGFFIARWHGFN